MLHSIFVIIVFGMKTAQAEYRVFDLQITTVNAEGAVIQQRQVLSVLDPQQYRYYYPLQSNESIRYTNTWKCPGDTSHFKPFCPAPQPQDFSLESQIQSEP